MTSPDVFNKYLQMGWSVFPVNFHTGSDGKVVKKPAVAWGEYQKRLATEEEVNLWCAFGNPHGIGLVTGELSGVVCVDVDTADNPLQLESSIVTRSAFSGGRHFFYKWSEAVRNTTKIEGLPIDFRGDGGYVVLPPSAFGDKVYEFESFKSLDNLTTLPEIITSKLGQKTVRAHTKMIGSELPDAFEGSRNHTATQVAGSLIAKMSRDLYEIAAYPAFVRWNQAQCNPPLDETELRTTFESVVNIHLRNHQSDQPQSLGVIGTLRSQEKLLEIGAPSTGFLRLDSFIKGFIPGHLYTMTGDTNIGKTSMACNFANSVSRQGKRVLYFALEPENTVVDYLASVRESKEFSELTHDDYTHNDPNIMVYGKDQIRTIQDLVKAIERQDRYDLIIIDHVGYFITSSMNHVQEQSNVIKILAGIAKKKPCAILSIAHLKKKSTTSSGIPTMDDISGSAAFKQDSTEVLIVIRDTDESDSFNVTLSDLGYIIVAKTKSGKNGVVPIKFDERSAKVRDQVQFIREQLL